MKNRRVIRASVGAGIVAAIAVCAAVGQRDEWARAAEPAQGNVQTPTKSSAPAGAQKAGEAGDVPKPRHKQDRAVPLAQLPAEVYEPAAGGRAASATRRVGTTTRQGGIPSSDAARAGPTTAAPKVADPLALARERLAKDAGLREWLDQWQVDVAAERPMAPARMTELRSLLEKTSLGAADLGAVAAAVAGTETRAEAAASSPVRDAWYAAAIDRAERELKQSPQDPAARRRLDELKAAATKRH